MPPRRDGVRGGSCPGGRAWSSWCGPAVGMRRGQRRTTRSGARFACLFSIPCSLFPTMQLESAHYMRTGDQVRHDGGRTGSVVEAMTLWATVRWDDGSQEEVEQ